MIASHKDLARRLSEVEMKYDAQFKSVFDAIRQLMVPPVFTHPPRGCQDSLCSHGHPPTLRCFPPARPESAETDSFPQGQALCP